MKLDKEILDSNMNFEKESFLKASIKYWEPRRILFNLVLVISMALVFTYYIDGVKALGLRLASNFVIPYLVIGNVFYTTSWLIEYFSMKKRWINMNGLKSTRKIILLIGMILSTGLTIYLFTDILYWHDWHSRN